MWCEPMSRSQDAFIPETRSLMISCAAAPSRTMQAGLRPSTSYARIRGSWATTLWPTPQLRMGQGAVLGRVKRNMPDPMPLMILGRLDKDFQRRGIGAGLLRDAGP